MPTSRVLGSVSQVHFPHRVQLWKPDAPRPLAGKDRNPTGLALADAVYVLAAESVPACLLPAEETDQPTVLARAQSDNIFTLDKLLLPQGVAAGDTWAVIILTPGDTQGSVYIAQGNPQPTTPFPMHQVLAQMLYLKRTPLPPRGVVVP